MQGYTPQEEMMYQPPELQNELQNVPEINLEQANAERNTVSAAVTVYISCK